MKIYIGMYILCYCTAVDANHTAYVNPEFIDLSASESVTFSCKVPEKQRGRAYRIKWNLKSKTCFNDCYFESSVCPELDGLIEECWCDDLPDTGEDPEGCPEGSTNVTFRLNNVGIDLIGEWSCIDPENVNNPVHVYLDEYIACNTPTIEGDSKVTENETATFVCTSKNGNPPAKFSWWRKDGEDEVNVTDMSTPDYENEQSTLEFIPRREWDSDSIKCLVIQLEEKPTQEVTKVIEVLFKTVSSTTVDHERCAENSTVTFTCCVTSGNPLQVNRVEFYHEEEGKVFESDSNVNYVIERISLEQAGKYWCVTDNGIGFGTSLTNITVEVLVPADITNLPVTLDIVEGQNLTYTCIARGDSPITYSWSPGGNGESLFVPKIERKSPTEYTCTAKNDLDITQQSSTQFADSEKLTINIKSDYPSGLVAGLSTMFVITLILLAGIITALVVLIKKGMIILKIPNPSFIDKLVRKKSTSREEQTTNSANKSERTDIANLQDSYLHMEYPNQPKPDRNSHKNSKMYEEIEPENVRYQEAQYEQNQYEELKQCSQNDIVLNSCS